MRKKIPSQLILALAFILILGSAVNGQITPTNIFTSFFDSVSTYNGELLPIGSVVKAYDPDGVLCGMYVVDKAEGHYGFMAVYGDDPLTSGVDEGAELGDEISFEINGRPATAVGDVMFADQVVKKVELSASATTMGLTLINPPTDMLGSFNQVITFEFDVRNDGDGLDFYGVTATSSQAGYTTQPQTDTVYAEPGETVTLSFSILTPVWPGSDTVNTVTWEAHSIIDPIESVGGEVKLYFTITDVEDDDNSGLPTGFTLYQNYPNPFNPTTTIGYSLPRASRVEMQVMNVLGQTIDRRELGTQPAGDHQIEYDASNLSSGIYFYRVVTEFSTDTRKMVLTK